MGIVGFLGAQARLVEARHRPPHHQQALPKEVHENGDPTAPTPNREARRPLGVLRPKGRLLRASHPPQRAESFHIELKWATVTVMRAPYGVFVKSLRFPKTNGRV